MQRSALHERAGVRKAPRASFRELGPWASAAIVVGTMIGTGIFLKPAQMAREAKGRGRFRGVDCRRDTFHLRALSYAN